MPAHKRIFDIERVKKLISESSSLRQVLLKLGYKNPRGTGHYRVIYKLIKDYNLDISSLMGRGWSKNKTFNERTEKSLDQYLKKGTSIGSHRLKVRLFKVNLLKKQCTICKIIEWQSKPAPLELEHINGITTDNRLKNLRILCANCHAQTSNYCGKNNRRCGGIRKTHLAQTQTP